MEFILIGNVFLFFFNEYVKVINGLDVVGNNVDGSFVENERDMVVDIYFKGYFEVEDVGIIKFFMLLFDIVFVMEVYSCVFYVGINKVNFNGMYFFVSDIKLENDKLLVVFEVFSSVLIDRIVVSSGFEFYNEGQFCLNVEIFEIFVFDIDKRLLVFFMFVFQVCNLYQYICNGVDSLVNAFNILVVNDGFCLMGIFGREDLINVFGIFIEVLGKFGFLVI